MKAARLRPERATVLSLIYKADSMKANKADSDGLWQPTAR
jgi:hypothetical protein